MTKLRFAVFLVIVLLPCSAYGQVTLLTSPDAFSGESVEIDFEGYATGVLAADILAQWGIRFEASMASTPKVRVIPPLIGGAQPDAIVENEPDEGNSDDKSLFIKFKYPVSKVGFVASNGDTVELRAWDPMGVALGNSLSATVGNRTFVGIGTTAAQGIAMLKVSYEGDDPEQIDDLIFEYLSRPVFTTYLPQVGDANEFLQSIIVVSNLSNSTAEGEVRFFESNATPLALPLNGTEASVVPFQIPPFSSKTLTSPGTSPSPKVGYGTIISNVPVEGTAIFRVMPGGQLLSEVGVAAAPARYLVVGAVQKIAADVFDSGVAIVNASDQPADVEAMLVREDGTIAGVNQVDLDLAAHNHKAKFMSELFPDFVDDDFQGTLVVTSDQPVGMLIVRTLNGLPRSALPVGSLQQR